MVLQAVSAVFGAGLVAVAVTGGTTAIHGRNGVALGPPPAVAVKPVTDVVGGLTGAADLELLFGSNFNGLKN